MTALERKCKAS